VGLLRLECYYYCSHSWDSRIYFLAEDRKAQHWLGKDHHQSQYYKKVMTLKVDFEGPVGHSSGMEHLDSALDNCKVADQEFVVPLG